MTQVAGKRGRGRASVEQSAPAGETVVWGLRLPAELRARLLRHARQIGESEAVVARAALRKHLDEVERAEGPR